MLCSQERTHIFSCSGGGFVSASRSQPRASPHLWGCPAFKRRPQHRHCCCHGTAPMRQPNKAKGVRGGWKSRVVRTQSEPLLQTHPVNRQDWLSISSLRDGISPAHPQPPTRPDTRGRSSFSMGYVNKTVVPFQPHVRCGFKADKEAAAALAQTSEANEYRTSS